MRRTFGIFLICCCATLISSAMWAPAGAQETVDTVTVGAFKQIDVEPDVVRVSFGISGRGRTAEGALDALNKRTARVLRAFRDAGFTGDDLTTTDVNLRRVCVRGCRRQEGEPFRPVFAYRGSAGIAVETNDLDRTGEIIDIGISSGASKLRSVRFDVEDRNDAVLEALTQAMDVAEDKARTLAESAGRELGQALVITEGRTQAPEARTVGVAGGVASGGTGGGGDPGSEPFPIEPPTLSASARVTVTYELE